MLDSFVPTAYRTEFTPWPVSERYAAARNTGTPEAQLRPGELTVHRGDGAALSYYLDWPENFGPADKPIALRPRYKNSYPQDFVLTVQVRDAQLLFSVSSRSFWEQRDGRAVERGLIARGYLPLDAPGTPRHEENRHEEAASSPAISSAPPLLGWDAHSCHLRGPLRISHGAGNGPAPRRGPCGRTRGQAAGCASEHLRPLGRG